MKTSV